jgi:hypothetical protein
MSNRHRQITAPDQVAFVLSELNRILVDATERGCESLSCSGVSFVLLGMREWVWELRELDARLTAEHLRALADCVDPGSSTLKRDSAAKRVRSTFTRLCDGAVRKGGGA